MNRMKINIKNVLALLLTGAMTVSVVGCSSSNSQTDAPTDTKKEDTAQTSESAVTESAEEELYYNKEGFPIVKEPITITMAGLKETTTDWESTHVAKKIEEMMGIKLECTNYEDISVVQTQFAAQMTSNTLPDLLINYAGISKAAANEYGADGYLLDFTDYLDVMPNFAQFLEGNPEYAAYHSTEDGSIYSLNNVYEEATALYGLYVSKEHQEKYGFSVKDIKTAEDFYEVLKSIKEQNPEAIPWSWSPEGWGHRGLYVLRNAFGIDSFDITNPMGVDNGQVVSDGITENGKAYLMYMNRLWEEELIDMETYVQTRDEYRTKIRNGECVFWFDWGGLQSALGAEDMSCGKDYDFLTALTSEYNEIPTYVYYPPYASDSRTMVSAATEYPEAVCRLVDYIFSEEGYDFFHYGTEGETYEWVENEMGDKVVSYEKYWDSEKYSDIVQWRVQSVVINNVFMLVQPTDALKAVRAADDERLQDYICNDSTYAYSLDALWEAGIRRDAEVRVNTSLLPLAYTAEESEAISQPNTDMQNLLKQYNAQFISGEMDIEKEWDKYVEQISVFWDQIQPIIQGAYDRMNK